MRRWHFGNPLHGPVPAPSAAPLPTLRQHDVLLGFVFAPLPPRVSGRRLTSLFTCYNAEQIAKGVPETPQAGTRAAGARGERAVLMESWLEQAVSSRTACFGKQQIIN